MEQISEHQALADELMEILNDAPYPNLESLKSRLRAARSRHSAAFNSGYEQEKLNAACRSVETVLTARGHTNEQKRGFAREDISKVRNLSCFRDPKFPG